ncbi:putative serine/threonine-protein kinase-like [Capsicum annuum]|nr:putative serine/threonine-protein kinase-like [Capsicum annuum]
MWNAASAHQVRKFEDLMWEIREENEEAYEYLMQFPLDKWTISHDDGKRWGVLTTNLSESFNGLLKKDRGLPVTAMVRLLLDQIVERIYEVRSIQVDGTGGNPHCVSLNDKKCDCGKWANLHFPCSYVMKVTERMGGLDRNFVSEHFTTENYVATYSGSFSLVGHEAY